MIAQGTQLAEIPETSAEHRPTHEQIASLARTLWEQRGCPEGSPEEDWFRAEAELLAPSDE